MKGNNNNYVDNTVCYSINNLGHITRIYYSNINYRIGIFPIDICKLKFLEEISLNNQNISNIPECVGKLERLKILNLSFNKITRVPESIKKLKNLENFYL
jgi:Leucine-rich repeat (LRR) protein